MIKSKELLFIRYISFFMLLIQIFVETDKDKFISVAFIFIIIINNHLRINFIEDNKKLYVSMGVEIVFAILGQHFFGGSILFYLIGCLIDGFIIKNRTIKYLIIVLINIITISITYLNLNNISYITIALMILFTLLLLYIDELYKSKIDAQSLYDKLRLSETKLKEMNKELENYADSVEQITLLKERNRISREIHDSVGHALSTAMIQLAAMESITEKENPNIYEMAKMLRGFIDESLTDVRKAVKELKPDEYESYQDFIILEDICKNFERLTGVKVKTTISKSDWNLTEKQLHHLEKITKEILSNSLKHGKATLINVVINYTLEEFLISFKDNGEGSAEIIESGVGLRGIKERVKEMDGIVEMQSRKEEGFFIKVIIPKDMEV
ncbi:sensor histidine kinase [Clostridium sp. SHJSY1]|uniref:sensor histidine kinase n=1 Tax=Clostridium sp. SHJSY1 TaxID=2942483 RepID=UPI002876B7E3|nr:sensor histidine kinase [Clostridium sp. SHJSY1]MDS0526993.1 sensor histidine kinase [Clostridium sp. SHJSY1]